MWFKKTVDRGKRSLGWDLHCHVLPAVDDGARSFEESLETIFSLKDLGYTGAVVTPHVYKGLYDNKRAALESVFAELKSRVAASHLDFELRLSAEYFGDESLVELAATDQLLPFDIGGVAHVLVEFPYVGEPLYWADVLSALCRQGYLPVIAHPERYRYLVADPGTWLTRFNMYGVKYQCDLGSIVGQYGPDPARAAKRLLAERIPTFWGSDIHRPRQADRFIRPAVDIVASTGPVNNSIR